MRKSNDANDGDPENEAELNKDIPKKVEYHAFELEPLHNFASRSNIRHYNTSETGVWRPPIKIMQFIVGCLILPMIFITIPIYLRIKVYSGQLYPVSMSDMRLIDKKVSTTWCQRQIINSNVTFNAFLVPKQPDISNKLYPVTMTRELYLDDDMKEYWGFYLLQGSVVTVSSCVRWPGASLIMIRGHKHLKECAYIGDDSSEELDEIIKFNKMHSNNVTLQKVLADAPTNKPGNMIRQLGEILFHQPRNNDNKNGTQPMNRFSEERDHLDAKLLKNILAEVRSRKLKKKSRSSHKKHEHIVAVPQLTNRYRDTNVNEDEERWLSFKDLEIHPENTTGDINTKTGENATENIQENEVELTSTEVLDDVVRKLEKLGKRGKSILEKLQSRFEENNSRDYNFEDVEETTPVPNVEEVFNPNNLNANEKLKVDTFNEKNAEINLDLIKQLIVETLREQKIEKNNFRDDRKRREIVINPALITELNKEDEDGNNAQEEEFQPDGYADHHSIINETTYNDMSQSEFWSSFSSSEEALLECEGLILNLPLTPHKQCVKNNSDSMHEEASLSNTITYRVPVNGYYFFVFNSENEIQTNYIRVKFDLQKTIYNLTKNNVMSECKNSTGNCTIPLSFFSDEKVVLEVPVKNNDSLWSEEFVVMSECEPRTAIYIICVTAVPFFILFIGLS